jgi:hypothetical protein
LRADTDQDISTVEDLLTQSKNVDLGLQGADPNVNLQFLPHKACADRADLNSKLLEIDEVNTKSVLDKIDVDSDKVPPSQVGTVSTSYTEQDFELSQGQHSGQHSGQHFDGAESSTPVNGELAHPDPIAPPEPTTQIEPLELETQSPAPIAPPELNLNEDEIDLWEMIQLPLAETDPEAGRQAALDIQPILKLTCANGCADKKKIWDALTEDEQVKFSALLRKPSQPEVFLAPEPEQQLVPEPIAPEPEQQLVPEPIAPEPEQQPVPEPLDPAGLDPVPPQEAGEPQPAQITVPESETITPEDAEKMHDIALIWWDEYYCEQLQSLLGQMFSWK